MSNLVKFKPEDLEYFKFHYDNLEPYCDPGDVYGEVYIQVNGQSDTGHVFIYIMQKAYGSAEIELNRFNENPAEVIADLRQIFSNFDEITLINKAG